MRVEYLRSEDMYANVLTKPLQGSQFQRERERRAHRVVHGRGKELRVPEADVSHHSRILS